MIIVQGGVLLASGTLATTTSTVVDCSNFDTLAVQANYANATTAGKTFTVLSQANGTLTMTAHGQVTGSLGQCSNSGGALPTGISAVTNYYIIVVDANTVKLASSLANAVAGTAIDITGNGTGTQTFTPTTSAGNILKAQVSLDGTNYTDVTTSNFPLINLAATVTISTSTGSVLWDFGSNIRFKYLKMLYTPSAGQITLAEYIFAKSAHY